MDFFKKLENAGIYYNERQKDAITYVNGPLLVAAGPGSGKTSVITGRSGYLIEKIKVNPSSILVITFTKAAANEMKQRFQNIFSDARHHFDEVNFGTFHSTFYKIINTYYGRQVAVLDQDKTYGIIKNILRHENQPYDEETVQAILNNISIFRTCGEDIGRCNLEKVSRALFLSILQKYGGQKKLLRCIDFDDMMIICKKILESDSNLLSFYRKKYKYFLIDEFQDSCRMQFDIVKLLCSPQNNICAVGDDDQSIYSFRGAYPHCMVDFEKSFKGCKTVLLNINYRSSFEIVELSKRIISNNSMRKEKDMKSYIGVKSKPVFLSPPDEEAESSFIADTIEEMTKCGYTYGDFAVLYRCNIQSRAIIDELIKRNMPLSIRDTMNNFYNNWICRDLTAYLKLSLDNNDTLSISRIINKPVRYIHKNALNASIKQFLNGKCSLYDSFKKCPLKAYEIQKIDELFSGLKTMNHMDACTAIDFIRKSIGYDDFIKCMCSESGIDSHDFLDIADEYKLSAVGFNSIESFLSHINQISEVLKDKKIKNNKRESVVLSTIHGAKGLEFTCVFIIGVTEGFLPHIKSIKNGENIDEERRLFYVAVTRSKTNLFISYPKKHHGKSTKTSRFISELSNNNRSIKKNSGIYNAGELISHKIFGIGKVMGLYDGVVEIKFRKGGLKQLDIKTCIDNKLIDR